MRIFTYDYYIHIWKIVALWETHTNYDMKKKKPNLISGDKVWMLRTEAPR